MQHYIELDIPETRIREQPAIENVEAPEPDSVPQVTAVDRTGRVYRPNDSGVVIPTEEVIPSLANRNRLEVELSDTEIQLDTLVTDPYSFIGKDVYKYFESSGI